MDIKHPNLCYLAYSEKLIDRVFAKDSSGIDKLLAMARQALDKKDYKFEVLNVINSLRECREEGFRLYFWEQIRVSDRDFYLNYSTSLFSGRLTTTEEEKIQHLEAHLSDILEKTGVIPYWKWNAVVIDCIGYIPKSGNWSWLHQVAERHKLWSEGKGNLPVKHEESDLLAAALRYRK